MSNLPKVVTIVTLGVVGAMSAGYYALTGQKGSDGKIVIATGGLPHYQELGAAYQKALEPFGVQVVMRPSAEGFNTLKDLVAENPQIDAGFVKGGLVGSMQGRLARSKAQEWQSKELGKLRSVGRLFYEPIWVFVRSDSDSQSLRELKGKRVLTGTKESGTRRIAVQLLRANGVEVSKDNPLIIDDEIGSDGEQLLSGKADAAFLIQPADAEKVQKLLHTPGIRLMNFALEADAYANRFPALTKVMLNRGAIEFEPLSPPEDITLLATSVALVVRADLEPSLMTLLTHAVMNNPRSAFDKAGDPVLFYRPGTFPHINDPEYKVAEEARQLYKTGELPIALRSIAPAVHEAGFLVLGDGVHRRSRRANGAAAHPLVGDPLPANEDHSQRLLLDGAAPAPLLVSSAQGAREKPRQPDAVGRARRLSGRDRAHRWRSAAHPLPAQFLRPILSSAGAHRPRAPTAVPETARGAHRRGIARALWRGDAWRLGRLGRCREVRVAGHAELAELQSERRQHQEI